MVLKKKYSNSVKNCISKFIIICFIVSTVSCVDNSSVNEVTKDKIESDKHYSDYGSIEGYVFLFNKKPNCDSKITIRQKDAGTIPYQVNPDSKGHFIIKNLDNIPYNIRIYGCSDGSSRGFEKIYSDVMPGTEIIRAIFKKGNIILGKVYFEDGKPAKNIDVIIHFFNDNVICENYMRSQDDGLFFFEGVEGNKNHIAFRSNEYFTELRNITPGSKNISVTLKIK